MAQHSALKLPRLKVAAALVALACCGLIGFGLLRFGYDSINVITLAEDPLQVWLYALAPGLGLVLALCFLACPPWVGVNLVEVLVLWTLAEVAFGAMLPNTPAAVGDPVSLRTQSYLKEDPRVGYVLEPNDEARHRRTVGNTVDYDVHYVIDGLGRRQVAASHATDADRSLLFFGDSNTFGEGLPQGVTLPDEMQRLWPGAVAYNYGVHGYGIAQMLDVIASRDLTREVAERRGVAFYYFIPAHMARLVGSTEVSPSWGRRLSYYRLRSGRAERLGDFATGRRFQTLLYGLLQMSNVRAYFGVTFPRHYSDNDYALAGAIVAESRDRLRRQFQLDDFYFVLSPTVGSEQAEMSAKIKLAMQAQGVRVIDLTQALDLGDRRYRVADDDYHQSAAANHLIVQRISERLATDHPELLTTSSKSQESTDGRP